MTPEEIETLIEKLIKNEVEYLWIYIILSAIITLVITYITEYVKGKGKNLATKQDIKDLTKKVEDVKSEYAKQFEVFKGGQQIKNVKTEALYDSTIRLKALMIELKNENSLLVKFDGLFAESKDLITRINSDVIFSKELVQESEILLTDYNEWMRLVRHSKMHNKKFTQINYDRTFKVIDTIQQKILSQ